MTIAEVVATRWEQRTKTWSIAHLAKAIDSNVKVTHFGTSGISYDFVDGSRFETTGHGRNHKTFWAPHFNPETQGPLSEGAENQ